MGIVGTAHFNKVTTIVNRPIRTDYDSVFLTQKLCLS